MSDDPAYVTQHLVARRAGVHQTTVSLVFRNHPSVPAATRDRVLAAARDLGYRRHPLLAALMSTRLRLSSSTSNPVLAFLTDFDRRDRWKESPTAVEMLAGARERAQQLGFRIETFWLGDPEVKSARLAEILRARNIHGLLLAPTHQPRGLLSFDFEPFAAVGLGVSNETSSILSVSHDHFGGMATAIKHCIAAGRKRIGVVLAVSANDIVRAKWLAAYAQNTKPNGELPHLPAWQEPFAPAKMKTWLKANRPNAIVGTFDEGFVQFLRRSGYRIPEDLGLISLSTPAKETFYTGIDQRSRLLGARAIGLLVSALNHNDSGVLAMRQTLQVEGEWVDRQSLRVAR